MLCFREAKLVWMVIFGRIQRRLCAAGVIPDNMRGSVPGRSTQEASFLYDMYIDDEDLEAFMASVDVKGPFCNGHMHAQGRCTHAQRAHTAVALADGVLFVCLIDCYQCNRD